MNFPSSDDREITPLAMVPSIPSFLSRLKRSSMVLVACMFIVFSGLLSLSFIITVELPVSPRSDIFVLRSAKTS